MNKLLAITVLVALLAVSAESFRVPRQAEEGTLTRISGVIRSYYDQTVNTASDCLESIKGMKLEKKFMNMYDETSKIVGTYFGIFQDQMYHFYNSQ